MKQWLAGILSHAADLKVLSGGGGAYSRYK